MRYFGHRASLSKVKYAWTCEHDQRMLVSSYNNAMHGNTIFIWRISIPGKLDDFCLAYVLFPLISPAFIYNVIIRLIKYLTHVKGMLHKIKQQIVRGRLCPVKRVLNAYNTDILYIYTMFCFMFKQCFIGLGLKGAHSSNYSTFQGRAPYIKACYSQNMFRCLGRILHDVFRETMCNFEGHILHDYKYHAFFISAIPLIVKRALHAQEDSFLTQKPTCAS